MVMCRELVTCEVARQTIVSRPKRTLAVEPSERPEATKIFREVLPVQAQVAAGNTCDINPWTRSTEQSNDLSLSKLPC